MLTGAFRTVYISVTPCQQLTLMKECSLPTLVMRRTLVTNALQLMERSLCGGLQQHRSTVQRVAKAQYNTTGCI
jgi:hypothetical protein